MQYRRFGNTPLQVSEIGFGCSRIGGVFAQGQGSGDARNVLHRALEAGITFYDTADMYSQGESESLIGQAFRDRRDQVVLATKGGYCLPAQRKLAAKVKPLLRPIARALGIRREGLPAGLTGSLSQNFSPDYLTQALEGSLRRLQTDVIDIYQLHSPPADVIAGGECFETLERWKQAGKIRCYGVAADTVEDALLCLRYPGIASLQFPFGLLDLEALPALFAQAERAGVGLIARGCFGGGLLKETLTESELREATPKWPQILALRCLAERQGRPVLEMALQFVLRAPQISVTLLGMRTEAHLAENLRFYAAAPLSDAEYREILAAQEAAVAGG